MNFLRCKIKFILSVFLFLFLNYSCIDPFFKLTPENPRILTVDGMITTEPGPHGIRLSYANQYSNTLDGNLIPVNNAQVIIKDDEGNEVSLVEYQIFTPNPRGHDSISRLTGLYQTPSYFKAEKGRGYSLSIITSSGKRYESFQETVLETPILDEIQVNFYKVPTLNPLIDSKGIEFVANFSDPANEQNYYFWNLTDSHFALETEPHLYHLPPTDPTCPRCPAPKNCCNICYTVDFLQTNKLFSVSSDQTFNGLATRHVAARIPDNGIRFKNRYRVRVNQYAISERSYRFLRLIRQQLDIQGSVFDPPPANIRGNIYSVDEPEKQVLGYFFVADVSSKVVYINLSDIPLPYRAVPAVIPDDCRTYNSFLGESPTLNPPTDWEYD